MTDTIFALSTGSYRSAIAVIRVSGPKAVETFQLFTAKKNFIPRQGMVLTLTDPVTRSVLDFRALVLVYPGPASFTGEDTVEFNVHGGRAVIEGILRSLSQIPACRPAEPGEFTKRAFQNGKLDLTEAEAIADLIDAETEMQKAQAIGQAHGVLFQLYSAWAETLSTVLAYQEADIEFPEDDLPGGLTLAQKPQIEKLRSDIREHLDDNRRGERLRNGIRIAIIGAPNAGKSSLMNALARRDVAIVSEEAGTTRDVIEVHLDLGGYPVILADTAGLRETENRIEAEGIRRAENAARDADLKIALFDGTLPEKDAETMKLVDENTVVVFTKADIAKKQIPEIQVSSSTGEGIDTLLKQISAAIGIAFKSKPGPVLTRERHRTALLDTASALDRCLATQAPELAAEDLRLALRALGTITGRVHVEDLLDKIFRDFCIGK
ncbi:MAG: tRNA uridine-5-carboxymethylaminomethyl(34) synthesis GTPase MnmE [Alphaproteobacteria bacterium]|jgi:tRNA modification GTPase|nr:tRNA uridine-5-carboxymethylaminomethyl(34) synthesis GTPase MnmE [Alphaproteobacteria bacterium]